MPDELTGPDSIRAYLTGAGSDGGAQADDDASLGNYRSSTELTVLQADDTTPIANVTVDFVSGENGTGNGTLTAVDADTLAWTAPGGSQGVSVAIANGETKILEDGTTRSKYIRVTRTSATALTGTPTVVLSEVLNNVIAFDNVASAEATAGDDEYRAYALKNVAAIDVLNLKLWIPTLATQQTTDSAQLGASGAGTITTTGSFSDWDDQGWAAILDSGGTLQEIVYYTSRTVTSLTVPAAGRGLLGTSPTDRTAQTTDTVDQVPGIRFAVAWPNPLTAGAVETLANESTGPTVNTGTPGDADAVTDWNTGYIAADGIEVGTLAAGNHVVVFVHRDVPAGAINDPTAFNRLKRSFDAA